VDPDGLNIEIYVKNYADDLAHKEGVYLMLDDVLGEYDTETYIKNIEIKNTSDAPPACMPLTNLPLEVDQFKQQLFKITH
jgi:hypothetical protein